MSQENLTPETPEQPMEQAALQPEPQKPEPKPILPDGIGFTLEQAKALLAKDHKMILANDEPVLMGVTICNAYLAEVEKLHARHKDGLGRLMSDKTDAYISGVATAVAQLTDSLSSASVEGKLASWPGLYPGGNPKASFVRRWASWGSMPCKTNSPHFLFQAMRRSMRCSSSRGDRRRAARPNDGTLNLSRIRPMKSESLRFAFWALRRNLSDALARSRCSMGPRPSHSNNASVTTRMARQPKYWPSSFWVRG